VARVDGAGGIPGRVQDPQHLRVGDLAPQGLEIRAEFLPKGLQLVEEGLAIILELLANSRSLGGGGCVLKFEEQHPLLLEVLVSHLVETQDQGLDIIWRSPEVAE